MATSVGPVLPGGSAPATEPASDKTQRSIAEARRLLAQNRVTGAKAMRIINMLTQAQQNASSGKSVNAQRMAREALKLAQDEGKPVGPPDPNAEEKTSDAINPNNEAEEDTPASEAQGIDPNRPFARETTSYADGSDDSGVSFQSAQPITPNQAPFAVRQHELSHVRRETSDAILNGQKVMASVTIHSHIDPRTGQQQVGGGRARIIVFPNIKPQFPTGGNMDVKG